MGIVQFLGRLGVMTSTSSVTDGCMVELWRDVKWVQVVQKYLSHEGFKLKRNETHVVLCPDGTKQIHVQKVGIGKKCIRK